MAVQEIKYICEICGRKYPTEEEAEKCEKGHYKPIEIKDFKYDSGDNKKQYPLSINVKLKDGNGTVKIVTYTRK